MAHKRNPVDATAAIAASRLALALASTLMNGMAQEHERGIGGWQAEWAAIPELFGYTAGAVARTHRMLDGLEVNVDRMRANLDASIDTTMAASLGSVSDPASYLGSADAFIDRALATYRRATSEP
jgi:3-carboxy-cis,cis-muconate cycloisomerase